MFDAERINGLIKSAKLSVTVVENLLLEATINYQFNSSDWNKSKLDSTAKRLAECKNYLLTLQAMLDNSEVIEVTPKEMQDRIALQLPR